MKFLSLLLLITAACSSSKDVSTQTYVKMNYLWNSDATKNEVIRSFGNDFKEQNGGIVYWDPQGQAIERGHFFDRNQQIAEQFILLDEKELINFKSLVTCAWSETEKMESVGHTVYSVKRGKCQSKNISYEFKPGSNTYEVRWKK